MKKWIWILVLVFALTLVVVVPVSANGGPHGGYNATTDACAGCHRAHTATGPKLLVASSTYALCITCHGAAGSGANTNVEDGIYLSSRDDSLFNGDVGAANTPDNASLLGGGFVNYGGQPVTSTHDPTGSTAAAWGNGVARGSTANLADGNLTCASCHDPHGSNNYRIIKETINGVAVTVSQVDEGAAKDYDTEQWPANVSNVCKACHTSYHVTRAGSGHDNTDNGTGNADYGADISTYAHRIDMPFTYGSNQNPETTGFNGYTLPLADSAGGQYLVVCQTCHLPHGTSAQMTNAALDPNTNDSALLRLDNRGVCEVCHQK